MSFAGKKVIVVGGSSGIGAAVAEALAARGARVAILGRRRDELDAVAGRANRRCGRRRVLAYAHDVAQTGDVPALFQEITSALGGLDCLVYAAGAMPRIAADEYDFAKDRQMVEVNFLGAVAWINEAAMRLERTRSGWIVGIGSIAGDRGRRGNPVYGATKAALSTYLESIHNRLRRHGVGVTIIRPGFVDTAMTRGLPGLFWMVSPERAAELILRAVARRDFVAYVPERWRLVSWIVRSIPPPIFRYLSF